jgi:hypothetical protein
MKDEVLLGNLIAEPALGVLCRNLENFRLAALEGLMDGVVTHFIIREDDYAVFSCSKGCDINSVIRKINQALQGKKCFGIITFMVNNLMILKGPTDSEVALISKAIDSGVMKVEDISQGRHNKTLLVLVEDGKGTFLLSNRIHNVGGNACIADTEYIDAKRMNIKPFMPMIS